MYEMILYGVTACIFFFYAFALSTENFVSAMMFKIIPGILGVAFAWEFFKLLSPMVGGG